MSNRFEATLRALAEGGVRFIVVGGVAAAGRPKDLEAIAELELLRDRSAPR